MTNNTTNSSTEEFLQLYWFVLNVSGIVVCLLILVVNLATILTFVINRHLLRRGVYCLINLAVADMLYGLFRMIQYIMAFGEYFRLIYIFMLFAANLFVFISLLSLVVVSLDRVYATFFPFRHRTTRLRMYIAVFTITWLLPIPIMIIFQLRLYKSFTFVLASSLPLYVICLAIICTSYTAIFVQVKIQAKRLQPNQQQTAALRQRRQKREKHLAMTLFIVTVSSLITLLPYIICRKLFLFASQNSYTFVHLFSYLLRDSNSLINPIVYVFRMRDFRKALKKLIFKCSRDQQQIYPIGHHANHDRQQQPPIELQEM